MSSTQPWEGVERIASTPSSRFAQPGFEPGPERVAFLREDCPVLVLGAGGLGCELLKDLSLCGFRDLHVIDMDTIDVSNLNRQFLFRQDDVGKNKADVAARFVERRMGGAVKVTAHVGRVQDFSDEFYAGFRIVVSGLDNVEARRWVNATLAGLVDVDDDGNLDPSTIVPMIDGGSEGFKGHARVILPRYTACFECTIASFPKQVTYPMCTIANTPRLPEHCVAWAFMIEWGKPENWGSIKLDADNPDHIQWVLERAVDRAREFGIEGVNYMLAKGVTKSIIPAIASTNAIVAAACANEALKVATSLGTYMDNYMFYNAGSGVYAHTLEYERVPDCPVCGQRVVTLHLHPDDTLQALVDTLTSDTDLALTKPSLRGDTSCKKRSLYMRGVLEAQTKGNLVLPLRDLLSDSGKSEITVTDPTIPSSSVSVKVILDAEAPREASA